jgi:crotonobetainyl-CoA:carnitine CoA-transferase CaiB-like acyl-CoA transferase
VGVPVALSETPGYARHSAPEFGQHTEEVLLANGYDWEQIEGFRERSVI